MSEILFGEYGEKADRTDRRGALGGDGLSAQNYQCAVGVRGGVTATGLSVRYHFDPVNTLEGMLDFAQGFNIYALYERTIPVIGEGFEFY